MPRLGRRQFCRIRPQRPGEHRVGLRVLDALCIRCQWRGSRSTRIACHGHGEDTTVIRAHVWQRGGNRDIGARRNRRGGWRRDAADDTAHNTRGHTCVRRYQSRSRCKKAGRRLLVSVIDVGISPSFGDRSLQVTSPRAVATDPRESDALVRLIAGVHAANKVFGANGSNVAAIVVGATLDGIRHLFGAGVRVNTVGGDVTARSWCSCRRSRRRRDCRRCARGWRFGSRVPVDVDSKVDRRVHPCAV